MTEEEQLIEKNNELREQLSSENKEYYEKILIYIRTKYIFTNELDSEEVLLELLYDILEAQKNHETASDYFGDNPQLILDELLKEIPTVSFKKKLKLVGIVFLISSGFALFSTLTKPVPSINLLTLLFNGLISLLFVDIIFRLINHYTFKPNQKKIKEYSAAFIISFCFIGLTFLSNYFGDIALSISVSHTFSLSLVWLTLIIISIWVVIKKKKEFYYIIPSLAILAIIPTLQYLPVTKGLFYSTSSKVILIIIMLVSVYGLSYLSVKKNK